MKLTAFLTLAFITSVFANTQYQNAVYCGRKTPATNAAISAFCQRKGSNGELLNNIVVPSPYAKAGKTGSHGGITMRATITGSCAPAQWVPITYCISQFQTICGHSTAKYGGGVAYYGRNKCQKWVLTRA